jgi:hypothetical protein
MLGNQCESDGSEALNVSYAPRSGSGRAVGLVVCGLRMLDSRGVVSAGRTVDELLSFLFELLAELFLQLLGQALLDVAWRAFDRFFESDEFDAFAYAGICFALGAFTGGLSLLVFPHALIRPSRQEGSACWSVQSFPGP